MNSNCSRHRSPTDLTSLKVNMYYVINYQLFCPVLFNSIIINLITLY